MPNVAKNGRAASLSPALPPPSELSLGLSAHVVVSGVTWWLRRVRIYADPGLHRVTATAYLERRHDPGGADLEAPAVVTLELHASGETVGAAALALLAQLVPAAPALYPGPRS